MVNLEEWENEEQKRFDEVISSLIDRVIEGEEISLRT